MGLCSSCLMLRLKSFIMSMVCKMACQSRVVRSVVCLAAFCSLTPCKLQCELETTQSAAAAITSLSSMSIFLFPGIQQYLCGLHLHLHMHLHLRMHLHLYGCSNLCDMYAQAATLMGMGLHHIRKLEQRALAILRDLQRLNSDTISSLSQTQI